jgi:hypothetical protein
MLGAQAASAAIVTETTDFANDDTSPTVLPAGTNGVDGHVHFVTDQNDYFRFEGLRGDYGSLPIDYALVPDTARGGEYSLQLTFFNSALNQIGFADVTQLSPLNGSVNVTMPNDGVIIGRVFQSYSDSFTGTGYDVSFDAAAVPEPATGSLAALSAVALLARRKRPQQAE